MGSVKDDLAKISKLFAQTLLDMSEEQFHDLLEGNGSIKYVPSNKIRKEQAEKISGRDFSSIIETLSAAETREAAIKFLSEQNLLKSDLIKLTSLLNIFIHKSDRKEKIIDKIVESTVGIRMRSKAIKDIQVGIALNPSTYKNNK